MAGYNKVILMGNLTRDPQVKQLQGNLTVCEFGMAVNRKWKDATGQDREDVLFIDCTAFGKRGETIGQYLRKGSPVHIEGRLKLDRWEDNEGGKHSKITVIIEQFRFVGSAKSQTGNAPGQSAGDNPDTRNIEMRPPKRRGGRRRTVAPAGAEGEPAGEQFKDNDIPF
ncbi:MAG TPA: single-stranded DNA-binding protein [Tepidisphaeraceae bacterium]|nr:single-stranded DNA-binding protein [Tepidisphaeraceae bacterium]